MTGAGGHRELLWRLLGEPDLPALTELYRRLGLLRIGRHARYWARP
jgi:hypothetical protein